MEVVEACVDRINCLTKELKRLFLVEDIIDSIKVRVFSPVAQCLDKQIE